ncbi:unnamed protein product [Cochlearia groenlandica]
MQTTQSLLYIKRFEPASFKVRPDQQGTRNRGIHFLAMKDDYEVDEKKQAAADLLFSYSKFAMAFIGNQTRPSDMRLHLMKEISGLTSSLKGREGCRRVATSSDPLGESSSSGTARLDR